MALDHSVRTPGEARKAAAEDLKVHLGLLDARPVAGDVGLLAGLRTSVLADWRNQAAKRLPQLHSLCRERAERAGELRFLLEPDLKESRGGCATSPRCGPSPRPGWPTPPARAWPKPGAGCSTHATRCTW